MIDIQALFIEHPERKLGACKKNILPEEIVMEQQTKLDHIASLVLTLVSLKHQHTKLSSALRLSAQIHFGRPGPF